MWAMRAAQKIEVVLTIQGRGKCEIWPSESMLA